MPDGLGLQTFPDTLRTFSRVRHDAIILDDVRDLAFVAENQDKLQGKYDGEIEFASTQGGKCRYHLDLFAIPIVVTINYSTKNRNLLSTHDWLGNPANREVVEKQNFLV